MILQSREQVARTINSVLTLLYWQIGSRVQKDILREKRAKYGEQILSALSAHLSSEFGRGFAENDLCRMVQFAEVFPDREIVVSLIRQLTWWNWTVARKMPDV